jgi:hypothetical protein
MAVEIKISIEPEPEFDPLLLCRKIAESKLENLTREEFEYLVGVEMSSELSPGKIYLLIMLNRPGFEVRIIGPKS